MDIRIRRCTDKQVQYHTDTRKWMLGTGCKAARSCEQKGWEKGTCSEQGSNGILRLEIGEPALLVSSSFPKRTSLNPFPTLLKLSILN